MSTRRTVAQVGDSVAGNVCVAIAGLLLRIGIACGVIAKVAVLWARAFRRGYSYGYRERWVKTTK